VIPDRTWKTGETFWEGAWTGKEGEGMPPQGSKNGKWFMGMSVDPSSEKKQKKGEGRAGNVNAYKKAATTLRKKYQRQ